MQLSSVGLQSINFATSYRTGESDPAEEFYRPCLENSIKYNRAVGYFRSSVYLIIGQAIINFAKKGGKIRLICSPSLEKQDAETISDSHASRLNSINATLISEIDSLLAEPNTSYRTQVLATLINVGCLDIRVALRPEAYGLYHEKLGIFTDNDDNKVSFLGSANETWNGWHFRGNHEAIEVFNNWSGTSDNSRVNNHEIYFERLWQGLIPDIEIVNFPEAAKNILLNSSLSSLEQIDMSEKKITSNKRSPLPHQIFAIEAWKANDRRGVFQHATGSGKTYTAIIALKEHLKQNLPAIVLVPSTLLLEQWLTELKDEIPDAVILLAGAGNDKWKKEGRLRSFTDPSKDLGPRLILSTMQTAATENFYIKAFSGNHLMIVADEVHQIGSSFNSQVFNLNTGPRLGLSATPIRYGDPEGTEKIFDYFGPILPPAITLQDAINAKRLVEYEYHPHAVYLSADEAEEWKKLTLSISQEMARQKADDNGNKPLSEKVKLLLIRRSRIAKKAAQKIPLAASIIKSNYEQNQHWLIYCEDQHHLKDVMEAIRSLGLNPLEYHSAMTGDKVATLESFKTFGGILVSIKCLDEGIDIPSISHAMILASSQNPRQFIQRRGRVLRHIIGKHKAVLFDAVVVPINLENEPDQLSLLKSEFIRAIEFADSALNKMAGAELRSIATSLNFEIDTNDTNGIEEE